METITSLSPALSEQPQTEAANLPKLLKPEDAAKILQVEKATLVRWARLGYLPGHPMGVGSGRRRIWRFYEHELLAWASLQTNGADGAGRAA